MPDAESQPTRVLIVDDDTSLLYVLGRILDQMGCAVCVQASPLDALELVKNETFDVVVADLEMPEMTGDKLAAQVREIQPQTRIGILSGSLDLANTEFPGVSFVVRKGSGTKDLVQKILAPQ